VHPATTNRTYFEHTTAQIRDITRIRRCDVDDKFVDELGRLIPVAFAADYVAVPGHPGFYFAAQNLSEYVLTASVWAPSFSGHPGVLILSIAVAIRTQGATEPWKLLNKGIGAKVPPPPGAPWVADRWESGLSDHPDAIDWTPKFSCALAWAWLDYRSLATANFDVEMSVG